MPRTILVNLITIKFTMAIESINSIPFPKVLVTRLRLGQSVYLTTIRQKNVPSYNLLLIVLYQFLNSVAVGIDLLAFICERYLFNLNHR